MRYVYNTYGTCSRQIMLDLDGDLVKEVKFTGGCHGNSQGLALLATGRQAAELITTLTGIRCGDKGTSCPDQLAQALQLVLKEQSKKKAAEG